MLDSLGLGGRLLGAIPVQRYLQLLPWHFTALLVALGVLAGFGLHHLIGCTFGFYRADGRHRSLPATVSLWLLLGSVLALLLAYVVGTHPEALVRPALAPEGSLQPGGVLGSILLAAPFSDSRLAGESHVAKERLAAALAALKDPDYRAALESFVVPEDRLVLAPEAAQPSSPASPPAPLHDVERGVSQPGSPATAPPAQPVSPAGPSIQPGRAAPPAPVFTRPDDLISAIVVQMGLRWLLKPDQAWPEALPAGPGNSAVQPLRLPPFALALIGEIQDGAALDRPGWERVAGTRFVQVVLQPLLLGAVVRWAGFLTLGVLLADAAYFVAAARYLGRLRRKSGGGKPT